jgi:Zn-dependent protease/CBS domain-containing protein
LGSIQLGRLFGIRLAVNGSWFFVFALVSWSLAVVHFPQQYPRWPQGLAWAIGIITSLLFFACVLLHELAHSMVAVRYRVPVRSITLFIFGGVSHISREATRPRVEFLIALAGPMASVGLAVIFGVVYLAARHSLEPLAALSLWLAGINISLAIFNMLPGLPLDGGRVLRSVLWFAADDFGWATRMAALAGQLGAVGMLLGGFFLILVARDGVFSGLWLSLIGWFMFMAAASSKQATQVIEVLQTVRVRDVMRTDLQTVESSRTLVEFADLYLLPHGQQAFLVTEQEHPVGVVGLQEMKRVPSRRWARATVREAMRSLEGAPSLAPETAGDEALRALVEAELESAPVWYDEQIVGLVSRTDLLRSYEVRRRRR